MEEWILNRNLKYMKNDNDALVKACSGAVIANLRRRNATVAFNETL